MATLDTKKKIVTQANNALAPQVTPTTNPNPTSINTGIKTTSTNTSSITTPKINQYSAPSTASPTTTTTNKTTAPKSNIVLPTIPKGSIAEKYKPTIDEIQKQRVEQLTKEYEAMLKQIEGGYDNTKKEYELDKTGVNNNFNTSKEDLGDALYNQHEQLNVSGANRGINYSPQALGLEQVNNIGYNKNLTKLMEQKNQLLSEIDMKIANLGTERLNTLSKLQTELQGNLSGVDQDYMDRMMELIMMGNDSGGSSSGSSGSGSGSGYGGWSNYYTPNWVDYSKGYNTVSDASAYDNSVLNAGIDEYKQASTDAYNNISRTDTTPTLNNYFDMSSLYKDTMDLYDGAFDGAPKEYIDEVNKTKQIADNHLFNRARANSTNTPYKAGDTYITPALPWNDKTIDKNKAYGEVISQARKENGLGDFRAKIASNAFDIHDRLMKGKTTSQLKSSYKPKTTAIDEERTSSNRGGKANEKTQKAISNSTKNTKKAVSNSKKNTTTSSKKSTSNSKKSVKKSVSNTKKSVSNSKKNTKKSTSNSKKNTKKSVVNSKKNTKKSTNNSWNNLKKNVKKIFHL
ncbi:hypothetical protein [Romboutsia sp.]|uniref:hypothetical protein n=1 Tax=Romboutsia sp. TaxID=1965302 RepID=UPI002C794973|nr:hypothetical protein [Romboutsia sp.]HSQ90161.1 hypothetical protein [Romboutsia sp.]